MELLMPEKRLRSRSEAQEALEPRPGVWRINRHRTRILALGLLLGPLGCNEPISPDWSTESYLGIYGVLLAGSDTAAVIAQRGIEGSTSYEAVTDGQLGVVSENGMTWLIRENPDLPGCVAVGPTIEEAEKSILAAIRVHVEGMETDGEPVPKSASLAEYLLV